MMIPNPLYKRPLFAIILLILTTYCSTHPLDPLTPLEINHVYSTISQLYSPPSHNLSIHYMGLADTHKPTTTLIIRRAFVLARVNKTTHEITLDITPTRQNPKIISDKIYTGYGYPILAVAEQESATELVLNYAPLAASVSKRGLKLEEIVCLGFVVGWYGVKKREGRIVKVQCYYMDGTVNFYMRPVEGITVTVDLDEMKIVGFRDRVVVTVPKGEGTDYRECMQNDTTTSSSHRRMLNAVSRAQPGGPGFTIDGHVV
ncbi:hypothetical protein KSS87_015388 [Heliosperma pusillum]|nr:hypothetical protein KSS87_015388 [Heliosperma pusillum]